MVLATHVIFGAYGFWLPNDPRGSWSNFVGSWELARLGRATRTVERRSLAKEPHDHAARLATKRLLEHPPVRLSGRQARAVARGLAAFVAKADVTVWACSVLPDHLRVVVASHRTRVEQIVILMKGAATRQLICEGLHPLASSGTRSGRPPKVWARGQWKVFLDSDGDVRRAIRYVEENPVREGKPRQRWSFVTEFDGVERSPSGHG